MSRITLVTGVSRGIGRAIADRMLAEGHTILGLARTPPGADYKGEFQAVDLSDPAATAETLAHIAERYAVDHVVNNVGIAQLAGVESMTLEDFDVMISVNLRAAVQCVQACLPAMRRKGRGQIVNIGSRAALGKAGRSAYGATKAGLVGLTRTWALELAAAGITVNCVAPGPIETEMIRASYPADSPNETLS